jgi:hypothetical protein
MTSPAGGFRQSCVETESSMSFFCCASASKASASGVIMILKVPGGLGLSPNMPNAESSLATLNRLMGVMRRALLDGAAVEASIWWLVSVSGHDGVAVHLHVGDS